MSGTVEVLRTPLLPVQVISAGNGRPVLYLHDVLFDIPTGDRSLPPFLTALAASMAVRGPALPGFGDLAELASVEQVEDYVFLLVDVLAGLGLTRPDIVGVGFGGWLAAELAVRRPDLVGALVLVNAFGLSVEGEPTARFFDAAAPNPTGGRREVRELLFAEPSEALALEMLPDHQEDAVAVRFFAHVHAAARIGWEPPAFYNRRLRSRLARIEAPTLVVWGGDNALVPVAHGHAYADGIPDASLVILAGAGHAVAVERPIELAEVVVAFLERPR